MTVLAPGSHHVAHVRVANTGTAPATYTLMAALGALIARNDLTINPGASKTIDLTSIMPMAEGDYVLGLKLLDSKGRVLDEMPRADLVTVSATVAQSAAGEGSGLLLVGVAALLGGLAWAFAGRRSTP